MYKILEVSCDSRLKMRYFTMVKFIHDALHCVPRFKERLLPNKSVINLAFCRFS